MIYLKYKKLERDTLESGNIDAICYLADVGGKWMDSMIRSFKYNISDLDPDQRRELYRMNGLCDSDVLFGGEVHRIVCDIQTKSVVLTKVDEIDYITLLMQIKSIKDSE